ncbi:MAG TPA: amidase family protein, partial [Vicinamibacteria bacterium]|nr:amidase family protein [Vicinamibacteria bacterium]
MALPVLAFVLLLGGGSAASGTLELSNATIEDLNAAFDAGTLTSESLVALYLARIAAYDDAGPKLNAVLALNPKALEEARALDQERKSKGRRSPLHGIPVVLKDNIDTKDLPTTAGSYVLAGSIPPDDAFIVTKFREAGAVVLAKVNMSEFASGATMSSLGGASLNPHDVERSPSGSSGGTGVAIAAGYAPVGIGTDTGGSIRGPSAANGIVGLKPTLGLVSRDGIVPLALSFDTAGPMARHVYDVAAALGVIAGFDPADEATRKSEGKKEADYTKYLDKDALKGARLGIARDFMGQDPETDWIVEASLDAMRVLGATFVDVKFPKWLLNSREELYFTIRHREFRAQIAEYLKTLGPGYPKTLDELLSRSKTLTSPSDEGATPNPVRWELMGREEKSGTLEDYDYLAVRDHVLPLMRDLIEGAMRKDQLDAIVYPTSPRRPGRTDEDPSPSAPSGSSPMALIGALSPTNIANLTGFPDLIVP